MATRIVPFIEGMKIGLGYNRLTGDRLPTPAVQGTSISSRYVYYLSGSNLKITQ